MADTNNSLQQFLDISQQSSSETSRILKGTTPQEQITKTVRGNQVVEAEVGDVIAMLESIGGLH